MCSQITIAGAINAISSSKKRVAKISKLSANILKSKAHSIFKILRALPPNALFSIFSFQIRAGLCLKKDVYGIWYTPVLRLGSLLRAGKVCADSAE